MKKVFRYDFSCIFVVIGMVISFLVFSYYSGVNIEENQEIIDREKLRYANEVYISTFGKDFTIESIDCSQFEDINITVTELMMAYIDEMGYCQTSDIVLNTNELKYPLVSGRYPTEKEISSGERVVVLGQQLRRYTNREGGKDYITICGEDYRVTGYLGCEASTVVDYFVINFAGCIGDGLYSDMLLFTDTCGYTIMFQSDIVSDEKIREKINTYMVSQGIGFLEIPESPKFFAKRGATEENKKYSLLTYMFSIIIIVLVVEYWLICRRKEFAIRKAFGYTSNKLAGRIIVELFVYLIIAVLISEVLLAVFNVIEKRAVFFMVKDFNKRVVNLLLYAGITMSLLMIRPIYKIYTDNPIKMLVDKEKA